MRRGRLLAFARPALLRVRSPVFRFVGAGRQHDSLKVGRHFHVLGVFSEDIPGRFHIFANLLLGFLLMIETLQVGELLSLGFGQLGRLW